MKAVVDISLRYSLVSGEDENISRLSMYLERKYLAGMFDFPTEVEAEIMRLYEERYDEAVKFWHAGRSERRRIKAAADYEARRPIVRITKWLDSLRLHHLN